MICSPLPGCIGPCHDVLFPSRMFHFLSRCILPCQDVLFPFRVYHSLSGCVLHHQDVSLPLVSINSSLSRSVSMYSSLLGCILPCQDVLFPFRVYHFPVRMCSSPGCILPTPPFMINSYLSGSVSMHSFLLGCILPCQDVLFPLRVYHFLLGCVLHHQGVKVVTSLLFEDISFLE